MIGRISRLAVGLSLVATVPVGAPTAAIEFGVSSHTALGGQVIMDCKGPWGPEARRFPASGGCAVSGAITDRGGFVDSDSIAVTPHVRTLSLTNGVIRFSVYGERGNWKIIGGTRAYVGLRGRGWEARSTCRAGCGPPAASP